MHISIVEYSYETLSDIYTEIRIINVFSPLVTKDGAAIDMKRRTISWSFKLMNHIYFFKLPYLLYIGFSNTVLSKEYIKLKSIKNTRVRVKIFLKNSNKHVYSLSLIFQNCWGWMSTPSPLLQQRGRPKCHLPRVSRACFFPRN